AVSAGDLPGSPVGFGVVPGEQPGAQAAGQSRQPAEQDPAGRGNGAGRGDQPAAQTSPRVGRCCARDCPRRSPRQWRPCRSGELLGPPWGVVFAGGIVNLDHVASRSSSVQSLVSVSLGRCCSTGPAACPGYGAADGGADPGPMRLSPWM